MLSSRKAQWVGYTRIKRLLVQILVATGPGLVTVVARLLVTFRWKLEY